MSKPFDSPRLRKAPLLACALAATGLGGSATLTWSDAKPGLWEVTTTSRESGSMLLPKSLAQELQALTPAMRQSLLAHEAALRVALSRPSTLKVCMTRAELVQHGRPERLRQAHQGSPCQVHVLSLPAQAFLTSTCRSQEWGETKSEAHAQLLSAGAFTDTLSVVSSLGSETRRSETQISAKWLAASCDDIQALPGARTVQPPADACALLPAADVSKIMGETFSAPHSSEAPLYPGHGRGADCRYEDPEHAAVWLTIHFDRSASDANRGVSMFKGPDCRVVAGLGEDACFAGRGGLQVRQGNVWLAVNGGSPSGNPYPQALDEDKLIALARIVLDHL